jgi:pyruvate formate lyase activating enzyme
MKIPLFDVFYGTTHDGPGMRTTFFIKGCPLHCVWCHNPEGIDIKPQLWWDGKKCIGCMECIALCPHHALIPEENKIVIDKDACRRCFLCAENCPSGALSRTGDYKSIDEVVHEAEKSKTYYETFGGGATVSGGEPMMHHKEVGSLLSELSDHGIHTALDTCGNVPWEWYEDVLPYTDCVLYDIKLIDSARHESCTGAPNGRILDNFMRLIRYCRESKPALTIWVRTPLIPGYTDDAENITAIGAYLGSTARTDVERWELCSFNNLCADKYQKLQIPWTLAGEKLLSADQVKVIKEIAHKSGFPSGKIIVSGITSSCKGNFQNT